MAKGPHAAAQRVVLPNGMWLLLYESGTIKVAGYDRRLRVTEVLNRNGGGHVFIDVEDLADEAAQRKTSKRSDDLVTVERSVIDALKGIQAN